MLSAVAGDNDSLACYRLAAFRHRRRHVGVEKAASSGGVMSALWRLARYLGVASGGVSAYQ